ncbi:MAG TPA: TfoX/Sxy family protein [Thermoanaerobaculia bacterium]|jgi:TfoX/Sxy family transcriptional regulator of competence genes
MQWKKSSPALVELFSRVVPGAPAEKRQMFGYPAAFVNGNMFIGLHQEDFILRLPDDARADLLKKKGAHVFEPMPGRPMKEYIVAPSSLIKDEDELRRWIGRSLQYASSLQPKKKAKSAARRRG